MESIIKHRIRKAYIKFLDILHTPLRQKGEDPTETVFNHFIEETKKAESPRILEIGSRNVTGQTRKRLFPNHSEYIGFDIHPGDGVDVTGDAHTLSKHFEKDQFDFVYSISVFEHLMFPWKAILETNKVLKKGGLVLIGTHPVWPAHELPWDFWRFPKNGFHSLFNKQTGFEIISLVDGLPCRAYSMVKDKPTRAACFHTMSQGVLVVAKKIGDFNEDLLKWDIDLSEVTDTIYPKKEN